MNYDGLELDNSVIKGFQKLTHPAEFGYFVQTDKHWNGKPTVLFSYKFDSPEVMEIYAQFVVMEFVDLIGVVGGTLGLFVGFSFLDFAFKILHCFILIVKKLEMFYLEKKVKKVKKTSKVGSVMNQQPQPQVNTTQENPAAQEVNLAQVKTDHVNTDQVNTDQVNTDQVNTDQVNTDQVDTDQVNTNQVNTNQVTPAQEVDST